MAFYECGMYQDYGLKFPSAGLFGFISLIVIILLILLLLNQLIK